MSDPKNNDQNEEKRYVALCDRAIGFIEARGGAVPEDTLISHVFGNTGRRSMWRPLLRSVLETDRRVVFRADGQWGILGVSDTDGDTLLLDEFIAVDVETTGLRPLSHRVIEVAMYRYRAGELVERFESLVNPHTAIPAFISNLTTITNEHVSDAPAFIDIASRVNEFIGSSLIVGHNVTFDIGFLNAELQRADQQTLINERVDTMALAVKLLRDVRKPSLDRVAVAVGLTPRKIHRAGRDAQLTAEVALRLAREAVRQGIKSLDELKGVGTLRQHLPRDNVGRARAVLDRSWLTSIPRRPGVYQMIDRHGAVIYVGKAKNLRERVASYYSQPIGYARKMDGLLESMVKIETEVVGSELQALILESQLIRRFQPRYNTAMRSFEHYPYIKVDITNPWPRVQLVKVRKDDGARYFGPYRSASNARKTLDVIQSAVPLRTCTRSFRSAKSYGNPCLRLDLGQCLGPCVQQSQREQYLRLTHDVIDFLDGNEEGLRRRLLAELNESAEQLDFERAEKLRKNMRAAMSLIEEQSRMRTATIELNMILVQPSGQPHSRELMLILEGRVWASFVVSTETDRSVNPLELDVVPELDAKAESTRKRGAESPTGAGDAIETRIQSSLRRHAELKIAPIDHYDVDEHHILTRWLYKHVGHEAIIPIDPDTFDDLIGIQRWISAGLAVPDDVLAALDVASPSGSNEVPMVSASVSEQSAAGGQDAS